VRTALVLVIALAACRTSPARPAVVVVGSAGAAATPMTIEGDASARTDDAPEIPSYEQALAQNDLHENPVGRELTDAELTAPMRHARFINDCGVPDTSKVIVKVAVKNGRVAGVSVTTIPEDAMAVACMRRRIAAFEWPVTDRLDSFTTTY
jgi:hypothetical protein